MERHLMRSIATSALISVATTGCHATMAQSSSDSPSSALPEGHYTNVGAEWPLKFRAHYFGAHCFDTQSCEILYRGFRHGTEDRPSPSVESYGRPLEKLLSAGRGPIPNFPPPARVTWRSKDGTPLEAEIDIGEIFRDELIRHQVAREDALDPATSGTPRIIVEVNDRTINVYMRDMIALKKPQFPDRPHSDFRDDLIKVFSRTY
ncbi:hypothetical protein [Pseudoxanthomonas japonensis]|nr:hypothetical protein [Pseudoxanthomonas japonensis]